MTVYYRAQCIKTAKESSIMDSRNGLINFSLFIFLFIFSFTFSLFALMEPANLLFGIFALVGFVVCIAGSLFNGILSRVDGSALTLWFFSYAIAASIVTVWYLTRCGTLFGWW
jgi:hypothetical protein